MTTYEQGRAPEGAPVTWTLDKDGFVGRMYVNGEIDYRLGAAIETPETADRICHAFHVAALANEMATWLHDTGKANWCADWLRRYREACK